MVRHHAPALRREEVHVGGQDISVARALFGQDFDAFEHAVHAGAERLNPAHLERLHAQGAIGKHGVERAAYGAGADQPRAARMHAHHFVLISPAGHQLFDVALLKRVVKRCFGFVRVAGAGRDCFGFLHGDNRISRRKGAGAWCGIVRLSGKNGRGLTRLW